MLALCSCVRSNPSSWASVGSSKYIIVSLVEVHTFKWHGSTSTIGRQHSPPTPMLEVASQMLSILLLRITGHHIPAIKVSSEHLPPSRNPQTNHVAPKPSSTLTCPQHSSSVWGDHVVNASPATLQHLQTAPSSYVCNCP